MSAAHHELAALPALAIHEPVDPPSFDPSISDLDPQTLAEAKARPNWPKWQLALQAEYTSLRKRRVFGPLETNLSTKPIGFRLIFTKKKNAEGLILRYKVCLVAQSFTQKPGIDYSVTYSPIMDSGTFRYLLGMAVQYALETQLLDFVTAYLYGNLDAIVYIVPPPNFLPGSHQDGNQGMYSGLKFQKALYDLKQSGRMWYQYLREFLLYHKFQNDQALPYIFTLQDHSGFVIIAIYVDDLNLVGTKETTARAIALLTTKFEMKDLGKTSFCFGLQISHVPDGGMLLHQALYT